MSSSVATADASAAPENGAGCGNIVEERPCDATAHSHSDEYPKAGTGRKNLQRKKGKKGSPKQQQQQRKSQAKTKAGLHAGWGGGNDNRKRMIEDGKKHNRRRNDGGNNSQKKHPGRKKGNAQRRNPMDDTIPIKPLSINPDTRWKPRSASTENSPGASIQQNSEPNEARDARLLLRLLNKVTPSNFEDVVPRFIDETSTLWECPPEWAVVAIVERAAMDRRYAHVYAQVCASLHHHNLRFGAALGEHFLGDLVTTIPSLEPESDMAQPQEPSSSSSSGWGGQAERQLLFAKARQCVLGTYRFLGECFNVGVVDLLQIEDYTRQLLEHMKPLSTEIQVESPVPDTVEQDETVPIVALEGLCVLLQSCGHSLENSEEGPPTLDHLLQKCWSTLEGLVASSTSPSLNARRRLSFRIRHLVLELLELRSSGWNPSRYSVRRKKDMVARPLLEFRKQTNDDNDDSAGTRQKRKDLRRNRKPKVRFDTPRESQTVDD